jgi:hypothetical protein
VTHKDWEEQTSDAGDNVVAADITATSATTNKSRGVNNTQSVKWYSYNSASFGGK